MPTDTADPLREAALQSAEAAHARHAEAVAIAAGTPVPSRGQTRAVTDAIADAQADIDAARAALQRLRAELADLVCEAPARRRCDRPRSSAFWGPIWGSSSSTVERIQRNKAAELAVRRRAAPPTRSRSVRSGFNFLERPKSIKRLIPLTQVRLYIVAMPAFQNRRAALAAARADEAVRPAPFE